MKLRAACFSAAVLFAHISASADLVTLDFDTSATGSNIVVAPLVTAFGTITTAGAVLTTVASDPEFTAAGASGNNINHTGGGRIASLAFSFDVSQISMIFGGNNGDITIRILDDTNAVLDSFSQASTGAGAFAGPLVLRGLSIRRLEWFETPGATSGNFAALDNIAITTAFVPEPATYGLVALGALAGLLVRRRCQAA